MEESRLDRIEKNLDRFIQGVTELRESQKNTDGQIEKTGKQIREMRESHKESRKEAEEQMRQIRESQKKTDEQIEKTGKQIRELRESQKKTDEQIRELQKETDRQLTSMIKRLDAVGKQLGDLGLVQGEIAEELFYRNIASLFKDREPPYHTMRRNLKKKGVGEFDIVATDGKDLLVVEVKNKLRKTMIDDFINRKIPGFKKAFPKYRDCRLTAGIGALVVKDEVGRYAEKLGLYVLAQTDDGGAVLLNRKTFKAKEFN